MPPFLSRLCSGPSMAGFHIAILFCHFTDGGFVWLQKNQSRMHLVFITCENRLNKASQLKNKLLDYIFEL